MTRLVTLSPSVPASGLSLTEKVIDSVGGSIGCACSGSTSSGSMSVSATLNFARPAMAMMSPATASSIGARSMPRNARIFETRPCLDEIALAVEHLDRRVGLDRAGEHAAGDDAAEIGVALQERAEHAEAAGADLRRLDVLQHQVEQGRHVGLRPVGRSDIQPCLAEP